MFLDDEQATARIRTRRMKSTVWVAATTLAACLVTIMALANSAMANDYPTLSEVITPQLLVEAPVSPDQQMLFGALITIFSVAAAGLWRLSFRTTNAPSIKSQGKSH
jgi:hypothetical protein